MDLGGRHGGSVSMTARALNIIGCFKPGVRRRSKRRKGETLAPRRLHSMFFVVGGVASRFGLSAEHGAQAGT